MHDWTTKASTDHYYFYLVPVIVCDCAISACAVLAACFVLRFSVFALQMIFNRAMARRKRWRGGGGFLSEMSDSLSFFVVVVVSPIRFNSIHSVWIVKYLWVQVFMYVNSRHYVPFVISSSACITTLTNGLHANGRSAANYCNNNAQNKKFNKVKELRRL